MANLMQSSELERGEPGRLRALSLRDEAQASLEAACNAQALDFTLAEAAQVNGFKQKWRTRYTDQPAVFDRF